MAVPCALLWVIASAGSVSAECFPQPDDFPRPRFAFTATVSEVSDRVAPSLPGNADFDWHLALDVGREYRGAVPDRLEANGWDAGCDFTGVQVAEGDRLFIAAERLDPGGPRLITGKVLLWTLGVGAGSSTARRFTTAPWGTRSPPSAPTRPERSSR